MIWRGCIGESVSRGKYYQKIEQNIDNATGNRAKCQSTKVNKTIVRWSDPPLDGAVGLTYLPRVEKVKKPFCGFRFARLSVSVGVLDVCRTG